MSITNKKKVICHIPTGNQFENIKPIEVKCFLDENQVKIETNEQQQQKDVTATMMTIVPQPKRPISAPIKKKTITSVTDMVTSKPFRHLAILPSSKKEFVKQPTNLSETFTMYDGPSTTPNLGRSLDDTITINNENEMSDLNLEIPINIELNTDNNTTMSSICELVDQSKLQQKPHSLIGRYQLPNTETSSSKPPLPPSVHIATVYYGETEPPEAANKQVLIQQFYTQLEKMKATFDIDQPDPSRQLTTNTLTFDNGQVKQTCATNQLKEKIPTRRISSASVPPTNPKPKPKPPVQNKQKTTKISTRIQSAPVTMATQINKVRNSNPISSCKQPRKEKIPNEQKKADKPIRRVESAPPPNRIEIHGAEVTLLPHEEQECQKMYEKLQRLQPDGVCVDINTLRRALYPPVGTTPYSGNVNNIQTPAPFKSYRSRTEEIPQSWIKVDDKYVSKYVPREQTTISSESNPKISSDNTDIDRIVDQVKKHAAINYSYYTRTK